ncbi:hypothetical protein E4U40_001160, partial [Claviceps sp. LM458 group G5]
MYNITTSQSRLIASSNLAIREAWPALFQAVFKELTETPICLVLISGNNWQARDANGWADFRSWELATQKPSRKANYFVAT